MRTAPFEKVSAVVAALAVFPMLALVLHRGVDVPYWDEWDSSSLIVAAHHHTLTFAQLWQPHAEHRIFIANVLMLALDALGGWNIVREQIVSVGVLGATQLFIWLLVRRSVPPSRRGVAFLAITVLLFGLAQEENLSWGFQTAWFICNLGLIVAVWALARRNRGWVDVALAMAAATLASLSSTQGLIVWPAGLVALLAVPRRLAVTAAAWTAMGAVVVAVVRWGAPSASLPSGGPGGVLTVTAGYSLTYLGAPVIRAFGWPAAVAAGVLVVGALAAVAVAAIRGSLARRIRLLPWLALATYALLCAPMTALGRAAAGIALAGSSRYSSIASFAWIAAVAAACVLAPRPRDLRLRALGFAPAALVIVASLVQSYFGDAAWRTLTEQLRTARADLVAGDSQGLPLLYPDNRRIVDDIGALYEVRDGPFRAR